jgi:flagellar assembly protein FliH
MALIKYAKSQRLLKEAIVLDMGDLARQAERILQNAGAEARQILDRAHGESQALISNADQRGHAEGFERGYAEGVDAGEKQGAQQAFAQRNAQIDQLTSQWNVALQTWNQQRAAMLQEARDDILRFAFEVARQVVHRTVHADSSIVADQVAAALALLSRPTAIKVTIHPQDRPLVEQILPDLLAKLSSTVHATFATDEALVRGGCIVATEGGRVDASIETQLARIAEALIPQASSPSEIQDNANPMP